MKQVILKKRDKLCGLCQMPLNLGEICYVLRTERPNVGHLTIYFHAKCHELSLKVSRRPETMEVVRNELNNTFKVLERKDGKVYVKS